jgi:hypothetical protein
LQKENAEMSRGRSQQEAVLRSSAKKKFALLLINRSVLQEQIGEWVKSSYHSITY